MTTALVAGLITLIFTTLLTIAGVGAAFILIPIFIALGFDVHVAMATALLLNSIAMTVASYRFMRSKLVLWKLALPIVFLATAVAPFGAKVSHGMDRDVLLWGFVGFLLFAASMMLLYQPKQREQQQSRLRRTTYGVAVGGLAGFLGGLLGVGGGNFIVPVLVWLGIEPKKASATTSFIVIFPSFSGFLGHTSLGAIDYSLVSLTAVGSVVGAMVGAWLMIEKLKQRQVKLIIGVVLVGVAARMAWTLIM
jgi:uncharacterized membrane protein YfcA